MKKLALLLLSFLFSSTVFAGQVSVSKLRVTLQNGQTADFLTLHNESETEKEAFNVSLKKWNQKVENNEVIDDLMDTEDILASPKTLVLLPKQEKLIRIIINNEEEARKNGTYRLFITQLPNKEVEQAKNTISLLFKISLPVFALTEPLKTIDKMNIEKSFVVENGKTYLSVKNNDNQHVQLQSLEVDGVLTNLNVYILPKTSRKVELPKELSVNGKKEKVLSTDKGSIKIE